MQNALKLRLESIIESYQERAESKENQNDEPNVEKFNLENSRDEILELIASFNEPPFTIQRICELLYSPFKYYDRICTFFRGLEKNVRVISSNEWSKCPPQTTSTTLNLNQSTTIGSQSNVDNDNGNSVDVDQDKQSSPQKIEETSGGEEEAAAVVVQAETGTNKEEEEEKEEAAVT